jgi:hypothetical protein
MVDFFDQVITDEMNWELTKPYSAEEVSDALFQIGPLKAPGPDGFPARFFQRNCSVIQGGIEVHREQIEIPTE